MSTKPESMIQDLKEHGHRINAIFGTDHDPIELCKKLRRLENKQNRANENYCNLADYGEQWEAETEKTKKALIKLLGDSIPVYINGDPRGYALKIEDKIVRDNNLRIHTDMGGYGILAPDFSNEKF